MARSGLCFSAEQQQRIVKAIRRLDIAFPYGNAVFLDEVAEAVQVVTRRIYGVRRYVQWSREAGAHRRPSNATLRKAANQTQGRGSAAVGAAADAVGPWPLPLAHTETGTLSARREQNRIASCAIDTPGAGAGWMEAHVRAEVAKRALERKAARNRQLRTAMIDLERRLGETLTTVPAMPPKLTDATLEHLEQTIETVTHLEGTTSTLAGMERFLHLQNDAVRQQTQNEAGQLRQHIRALGAEVAHLNAQIDAYQCTPERTAPVSHDWIKPSS